LKVLTWETYSEHRDFEDSIVPLGDVHIGNAACDERKLKQTIEFIRETGSKWIGMGDFAEFIQLNDPRFDVDSFADWIQVAHLGDLVGAQRDRFLSMIEPIASQCRGIIEGNHERAIRRHYERDVYLEIVTGIKKLGGFEPDVDLALGVGGWINLKYYRSKHRKKQGLTQIRVNAHHGFTGGRLSGAKALNMQRWLWTHNAHLIIFGHSHNTSTMIEATEYLNTAGDVVYMPRFGCYSGTFLRSSAPVGKELYSERKGYLPLPLGGVRIRIRPHQRDQMRRIIVEAYV